MGERKAIEFAHHVSLSTRNLLLKETGMNISTPAATSSTITVATTASEETISAAETTTSNENEGDA